MKRRDFIKSSVAGGAILGDGMVRVKPASAQFQGNENGKYDILLKGGHVIDPANNINSIRDVAVANGKIARVDNNIPAAEAKKVVDVSGYYITPGLVDIHTHYYYTLSASWINPDHHSFNSCVTTLVDSGTSGAETFGDFKEKVIDRSRVRTLVFLNISKTGMVGNNNPAMFDTRLAAETALKYPDIIVGFKSVRYSWWERNDLGLLQTPPWASVEAAVEAGRRAGVPAMFHTDPEPAHGDWPGTPVRTFLLEKARPGDIYTHCFRRMHPVILDDGRLNPAFPQAQKRGVIFDVGHGSNSFVWRNGVTAIKKGFFPNSISTDIHGNNVNDPVINMPFVMSKFLNIGMSLENVIRCSTVNPARAIKRPELGTLSVGSQADIAVIEMVRGEFSFIDIRIDYDPEGTGGRIHGDRKLQPVMTLFGGNIVFDPQALSYPDWENIPADNNYWETYKTQLKIAPKEAYF
ncbi:amidohydrolase/deacetylase family metallohydrolase [Candidatus Latescibacterota bacterium]